MMIRDSKRSTNGSHPTAADGVAVSSPPSAIRNEAAAAGGSMTYTATRPNQHQIGSPSSTSAIGNFFKRIRSRSKSPSLNLRKSPSQPDGAAGSTYHVGQDRGDVGGPRRKSDTGGGNNPRTRLVRTSSRQRIKNWFTTSPSHKSNDSKSGAINTNALVTPLRNNNGLFSTTYYKNDDLNTASHVPINPRSALSEEDLVSKSLASELQTPIVTGEGPPDKSSNVGGKSAAMVVAPPGSTMMPSYYSQDSIFVAPAADGSAAGSSSSSAVKAPSYIRISCALNGYGGPRKPYRSSQMTAAFRRGLVASSTTTTTTTTTNHVDNAPIVMAKSIVERRLDKFQSPSKSSSGDGPSAVVTGKPPTMPRSPTTTTKNGDDKPQASVRDRIEALSPSSGLPQNIGPHQEELKIDNNNSPDSYQLKNQKLQPIPAPRKAHSSASNGNGPNSTNQVSMNGEDQDPPKGHNTTTGPPAEKTASSPIATGADAIDSRTRVDENSTVVQLPSSNKQQSDQIIVGSSSSAHDRTSLPVEEEVYPQGNDSKLVVLGPVPTAPVTETSTSSEFGDHPKPTQSSKGGSSKIVDHNTRKDIMVNESEESENSVPSQKIQKIPSNTNGISDKLATTANAEGHKLDAGGHKRRADDARGRLRALCHEADGYLQLDISEEAENLVRVAFGRANLLMGKKFNKFYDLIDKNLHPVEGDPEPILLDDLDGYWSIVAMEMDDVDRAFDLVRQMRSNDWTVPAEEDKNPYNNPPSSIPAGPGINSKSDSPSPTMITSSRPGSRNSRNSSGGANALSSSAAKSAYNAQQRSNDARKRLAEAKALARKKKVAVAAASAPSNNGQLSTNDEIQIFGAI